MNISKERARTCPLGAVVEEMRNRDSSRFQCTNWLEGQRVMSPYFCGTTWAGVLCDVHFHAMEGTSQAGWWQRVMDDAPDRAQFEYKTLDGVMYAGIPVPVLKWAGLTFEDVDGLNSLTSEKGDFNPWAVGAYEGFSGMMAAVIGNLRKIHFNQGGLDT